MYRPPPRENSSFSKNDKKGVRKGTPTGKFGAKSKKLNISVK